jgi:purine-binding chemotaxis protein CheW
MTGMSNVTKLAGEPSGQEFLVFTLGMKSTVSIS